MSDGRRKNAGPLLVPTGIAELHEHASKKRFFKTLSGMPALPRKSVRGFSVEAEESAGFKFLVEFGPRAVRAFKLLEVAQSKASYDDTARLNVAELELLRRLIGSDFVALACRAYADCKDLTHDPRTLEGLDERTAWRLTEFVHLFENVMAWGQRNGTLQEGQAAKVLNILVRDFGAYYGLLVDDVGRTRQQSVAAMVAYLRAFQLTPLCRPELPVDKMTRLPMDAPLSVNLLDYEIARGMDAHPIAVKERIVRGDDGGKLAEDDPVEFNSHRLTVFYSRDLDDEGRAIVRAILPVFAISAFDGFSTLQEVEAFLERRRQVIQQTERECFALLQCLHHYGGRVPPKMKEFRASDVMSAAQRVYRRREKEQEERRRKAISAGGMIKERLSHAVHAMTRPIAFSWPADRAVFRLAGYPENIVFFPQKVVIRGAEGEDEEFTFLCHAHHDSDPAIENPLMFEYQVLLTETQLFDAHSALRDRFANAPDTFRRTLDAGPVILFVKKFIYPDEAGAAVDLEEVKLLGTYVALNGGMKSWVGQHYILSRHEGDVFIRYPDVREYLSRVLPVR